MPLQLPCTVLYQKQGDKLVPVADIDIIRENTFINSLKEGEKVEITYETIVDNGSYSQLSKLHASIRQLALDTGNDFDTLKLEVKRRAGLYVGDEFKSFAKCSKEELSEAIRCTIQIGDLCGCNLHGF
jgi:DNA-directed RNA polymerase alpha subunit